MNIVSIYSQVRKREHKFEIKIPSTIEETNSLDRENLNSLWRDALTK